MKHTVLIAALVSLIISVLVVYGHDALIAWSVVHSIQQADHAREVEARAQLIWRRDHPEGWNQEWAQGYSNGPWRRQGVDQSGPEGDRSVYQRDHEKYLQKAEEDLAAGH